MIVRRASTLAAAAAMGAMSLSALTVGSAEAVPGPGNTATTLIIDSSGSMSWNDPDDLRKDGARTYLGVSLPDDEVGVVDFDSIVQSVQDPVAVEANRGTLEAAIDSVDSDGGTDLGAGLQAGCDSLANATATMRAGIFLTDGDGSYADEATCFADAGWPVYAIALGSSTDETLLRGIADQTSGRFIPLNDSTQLVCIFGQIRSEIGGGTYDESQCDPSGAVAQGQTSIIQIVVDPTTGQISVTVNYAFAPTGPGNSPRSARAAATDLKLTLVDPTGAQFSRDSAGPGVSVSKGQSSETVTVQAPVAGTWQAMVSGESVPNGQSQPFSVSTVQIAGNNNGGGGGGPAVEAPGATVRPAISGTPKFGETLSVSDGEWDQRIDSYSYQWLRQGAAISGATAPTYTTGLADVGKQVTALVTAHPVGAPSGSAQADPVLVDEGDAAVAATAPSIEGLVAVDQVITAVPGAWDLAGLDFSYAWMADGKPMPGQTGDSLALRESDLGKVISLVVTATKPGHADGVATSGAATVAEAPNPGATEMPAISGLPQLGKVLHLSRGEWSLDRLSYSYQWQRDGVDVPGATNLSYKVTRADIGRQVSAVVTASRHGYQDGQASAAPVTVAKVAPKMEAEVFKASKLRFPKKPRIVATVQAGEVDPSGTVEVRMGQEVLGSKSLNPRGRAKVRLAKMAPGTYDLVVAYTGDQLTQAVEQPIVVVVKKRK